MKVIVILIIFCLSCFFIPAFSQNRIDSLHQSLASRNGIEQFDALFEIAQLYGFWNFDSSIHYAQRARMVAEQYKDTTRLIKVNERLGVFYNRISEGVKAEEYLLIGLSLASRDTVQQVKILSELGVSFINRGRYDVALKYLLQAINLADKSHSYLPSIHSSLGFL